MSSVKIILTWRLYSTEKRQMSLMQISGKATQFKVISNVSRNDVKLKAVKNYVQSNIYRRNESF